jgi:hypothetical protein
VRPHETSATGNQSRNNAIKFTDQGSVDISFRTVVDEPFVEFSVADTGIGMAEESLPHIFDKFRQVDSTTTRHYSALDSGSTWSKVFVTVMGGSVSVQSTLGEGTTFTVVYRLVRRQDFLEDTAVSPNITATGVVSSAYLEGDFDGAIHPPTFCDRLFVDAHI